MTRGRGGERGRREGPCVAYTLERKQYADRWRPILGRTGVPIAVVWGDQDPIAVIEIGRRVAEMSRGPSRVLEGVGHYPQMEAPGAWVKAVTELYSMP